MTDDPAGALPDADLVRRAALAAVEAAAPGWLRLTYILWFDTPTHAQGRFWIEDATGRRTARPPQSGPPLLTLRQGMAERGQPTWARADLVVRRDSVEAPISFDVDFAYEAGDVPE